MLNTNRVSVFGRKSQKSTSTGNAVASKGGNKRRGLKDITNKYYRSSRDPKDVAKKKAGVREAVPVVKLHSSKNVSSSSDIGPRLSKIHISSSKGERVKDIDAKDHNNPQAVTEYVNDIMSYFRSMEGVNGPSPNYMSKQPHINSKMRSILIDWLVEVHLKFKLMPETLYLTINLIDRFLERKIVARQRLQLVGVTCMLLASKYEEIYFPEVRDFVYITDRAYTRHQILQMESLVLNTLGFELTVPTTIVFAKRFLKAGSASSTTKQLALYFCERTLQEYSMIKYMPSMIAASCVSLALKVNNQPHWSPTLERYTDYTQDKLSECMTEIRGLILSKGSLRAVKKKYSSSKFLRVAQIPSSINM